MSQENKELNGIERIESKKGIYNGLILSKRTQTPTRTCAHTHARYKYSFLIIQTIFMISEKLLESKLAAAIRALGGWSLKLWSVSVTGLPDRMVLMPGGVIRFVELKSTGKKPTPRQLVVHSQLRQLGFDVDVIDTEQQLQQFLNQFSK